MWQTTLTILVVLIATIYLIKKYTSGKPHCDPEVNKCSMCDLKDSCGDKIGK
ncbi:MAG: hypothetical protein PF638_10775 [Candidatus Delongbacteria bacterium]|jgi:hypothetical protein|nr:hypothetical protein [Candidatus Delongbacteria bacterium]